MGGGDEGEIFYRGDIDSQWERCVQRKTYGGFRNSKWFFSFKEVKYIPAFVNGWQSSRHQVSAIAVRSSNRVFLGGWGGGGGGGGGGEVMHVHV